MSLRFLLALVALMLVTPVQAENVALKLRTVSGDDKSLSRKVEEQTDAIIRLNATVATQETINAKVKKTAAEQAATIARQQKEMKALMAVVQQQAVQLQKVSAQLEAGRTAPQMAVNTR